MVGVDADPPAGVAVETAPSLFVAWRAEGERLGDPELEGVPARASDALGRAAVGVPLSPLLPVACQEEDSRGLSVLPALPVAKPRREEDTLALAVLLPCSLVADGDTLGLRLELPHPESVA